MGDEDELSNFDPRAYWAWENNETINPEYMDRMQLRQVDKLIKFLDQERLVKEILAHMKMSMSSLAAMLARVRWVKKVTLIRREAKNVISYQAQDFRQDSKIS